MKIVVACLLCWGLGFLSGKLRYEDRAPRAEAYEVTAPGMEYPVALKDGGKRSTKQIIDNLETLVQSIDSTIKAQVRVDQYLLQAVPAKGVTMTVHPVDFSVSSRGIVRVDCVLGEP